MIFKTGHIIYIFLVFVKDRVAYTIFKNVWKSPTIELNISF